MKSLNRVTLLGNLGRDAETKFTQSGIARTTFSMATARRVKDGDGWRDETDWHNVVLWRSEKLAQHLTKGKQVYVEGRLSTRNYEKDGAKVYVTEVVAEEVILLGGDRQERGEKSESRQQSGKRTVVPAGDDGASPMAIDDDDVPF